MSDKHKPGCDALGGYGFGVGACTCGMDDKPESLPFAVFDEFGNGADDRVQDHYHAQFQRLQAECKWLRADAERGRFLVAWLEKQRLLRAEFCKPGPGVETADWWVLQQPFMVDGNSCEGHGKSQEEAIDAARKVKA